MALKEIKRGKKHTLCLAAGVGMTFPFYFSLKVAPLHSLFFLCFRITIFPPVCESSIITEAVHCAHPLSTHHRYLLCPLSGSYTWFVRELVVFSLCGQGYHITTHMLMQQLRPRPPSQPFFSFSEPPPTMERNKLHF